MTKKVWVMIGAILAAAAAVVVACVVLVGGKNETYRSILVYQVNGNATITRERVGEMKAYENLMLQSGDTVAVASNSSMRLKLDDDKYVLAEQDTLMSIVAEGNDENARTYIDLQRGSVTSEIQNKLKEGATYEVNTPNSIMAVRGTIFRVDVEMDENNNTNTKLTVFQGTVGVKTIMPDGTVSEEETMVDAGNELTVEGTPTDTEYLGASVEIDYDSLPPIVQEYIEELAENGLRLGQDTAANASKAHELTKEQDQQEAQQEQLQEVKQQEEEPEQPETVPEKEEEPASSAESNEPQSKAPEKPQRGQSETKQEQSQEPEPSEAEESKQPETTQPEHPESEPQSQSQSPTPQTEPSSQPQSEDGNKGDGDKEETKTQYYTVTFQYNGNTFGTQKVKKGETATEPKLSPTENGAWDYDFSQKVNKNLVIQWKEK